MGVPGAACAVLRAGLLYVPVGGDPPRGLLPRGCFGRRRARPPARLGDLTSFGAAPRSPPVPSGPSGALHTSGAWCADVWLDALQALPPPTGTAARLSGPSLLSVSSQPIRVRRAHSSRCSLAGSLDLLELL